MVNRSKLDDTTADVFAEIEAERRADFGRAVDLKAGIVGCIAAGETSTRPPPSSAGYGMWRPGSRTGFSRSLSRSPPPGAVSSVQLLPVIDTLIAATARVHDMIVVTRKRQGL